jgi:hypothetical protein
MNPGRDRSAGYRALWHSRASQALATWPEAFQIEKCPK